MKSIKTVKCMIMSLMCCKSKFSGFNSILLITKNYGEREVSIFFRIWKRKKQLVKAFVTFKNVCKPLQSLFSPWVTWPKNVTSYFYSNWYPNCIRTYCGNILKTVSITSQKSGKQISQFHRLFLASTSDVVIKFGFQIMGTVRCIILEKTLNWRITSYYSKYELMRLNILFFTSFLINTTHKKCSFYDSSY